MFKYFASNLAVILVIAGSVHTPCFANDILYSVDVGYSKEISEASKYWNAGFVIGINTFYAFTPNILVGGHLSCHRWTPEGNPNLVGANWIADGTALLFNLYPSIRITTSIEYSRPFNAFIQFGVGVTIIANNATLRIVPIVPGNPAGRYADLMASQSRPGFSIGAGLTIMNNKRIRFEILPMYNVAYTSDEYTRYISVNIGVSVGM